MQVTDAMVAAAQDATPRWMNATDSEIRYIIEAALTVAGEVAVDVTANIRIQIDETEFRSSVADAVERLHDELPRDDEGRVTLATLHGAPRSVEVNLGGDMQTVPDGAIRTVRTTPRGGTAVALSDDPYRPLPPVAIPDDLLDVSGFEDPMAMAMQQRVPVAKPRALMNETALAAHFEVPWQTVATWAAYGDGFAPPFPAPATHHAQSGGRLWDMREVETWHKAWLNGKEPYRMPVTEPRPLARQSELHHHLGIGEVAVARMIMGRDSYRPPFPQPVHEGDGDGEALYDPQEVKAWYDALPQAADG